MKTKVRSQWLFVCLFFGCKIKNSFMKERILHILILSVGYFAVFLMMLIMTIVLMVILKAFLSILNALSAIIITTRTSPPLENEESCIGAEMENHLYLC